MRNLVDNKVDFSESILKHCLDIARGECSISLEEIGRSESEKHAQILYGLYCMNDELSLSRAEYEEHVKKEFEATRLKDINRELEQFAFKASHDLKEPIRTIFSFSQLLKNSMPESTDTKLHSYIDYIQISAKRMTDMITHLLDYARFGNQPEFQEIDSHILVQNINFDLISQFQKTKGKLIIGNLPAIKGDETLLRLLFQNIISNALKFKKENVHPIIEISSTNYSDHIKFIIKDNGVGISENEISSLFDIFARGESTMNEYEGTGIGLAHCKKIVDIHQGKIWCESVIGEGTSFYFTISKKLGLESIASK